MKKFLLVLAMMFMFAIPNTDAFKIHFVNDTDKTMIYHLTWLTCDWELCFETGGVAMMAGGELKPGKSTELGSSGYKAGVWQVDWDYMYYDKDENPDILPEHIETHQHGVLVSKPFSLKFYQGI